MPHLHICHLQHVTYMIMIKRQTSTSLLRATSVKCSCVSKVLSERSSVDVVLTTHSRASIISRRLANTRNLQKNGTATSSRYSSVAMRDTSVKLWQSNSQNLPPTNHSTSCRHVNTHCLEPALVKEPFHFNQQWRHWGEETPRVTPSRGDTQRNKIFCGQIYKE